MRYRTSMGGTLYGRTTAMIPETAETDLIVDIEIGATSGSAADDDPGSLSLSDIGEAVTPRNLGEVDVNIGTLSLNDSFVTGRIDVDRPTSVMVMRLSGVGGQGILVRDGGTFTAEASQISGTVREGGIARVSGCAGSLGSVIGADIEIDASILGSADFQGKQVITNTTITTGGVGRLRQGEFDFANVSLDVEGEFTVGGNTTGAVPTDTILLMTGSVFESATAVVRAGLGIATDFTIRGSTWRSFGLFQIVSDDTQVDVGSGSHIDARADLVVGNAHVTVASIAEESRIDVAGDFDLDGSLGLLTIEDGGYVDVDGTLTIGPLATLNLNGGTLRVGNLDNSQGGVLNENGGTLIVPEAAGLAPPLAATLALALLRRRRD